MGLVTPRFDAPFMPAIEVGWRLDAEHWGKGYATEAARAALAHGFETLGMDEIVSFTASANVRSRAVMERTGMERHPADAVGASALARPSARSTRSSPSRPR